MTTLLRIPADDQGLEFEVRSNLQREPPVELYLGPGYRSFTPDQADEVARTLSAAAAEARAATKATPP